MSKYTVDFETTTQDNFEKEERVRVWAVASVNIDTLEKVFIGNSIDSYFDWLKKGMCKVAYFHNLKFDGSFLLYYLFENGYTYSDNKKLKQGEFNTLIDVMGAWYSVVVCLKGTRKNTIVKFYDSYKLLPFTVEKLAKDFNCSVLKGEIDYTKYRPINYKIQNNEIDYIYKDCLIVAECLQHLFNQNLNKITIGSNALNYFKQSLNNTFGLLFPELIQSVDNDVRESYKGGFVYCNPKYKNIEIGENVSYDVNSLYPYVMYSKNLPYGVPKIFKGMYKHDVYHPLYIQRVLVKCHLKQNHIPTLQIKNNYLYCPTQYIENTNDEMVNLVLTSVDLELLKEHYVIDEIDYLGGYKFKACQGVFKDYIDYWTLQKNNNKGAKREISKLMLNSLYGKFGTNPKKTNVVPYFNDDTQEIEYLKQPIEYTKPVYTPLASFITAYARDITIRTAQQNYERFIYADTDSIHLVGCDEPNIKIHPTKLGYWDFEGKADKAKFIRAKTYIKDYNGNIVVKCAGMTNDIKEQITFDNFASGITYTGKLQAKKVKGGTLLNSIPFTIK